MARFKISLEIDTESDSPLQAAKELRSMLNDAENNNNWQFYVQNTETNKVFSVDLEEDDENAVLPVNNYMPFIVPLKAPRYKHDCHECIYLGQDKEYDLYFCPQLGTTPTVVARFSSNGPDYMSGLHAAKIGEIKPLAIALNLAIERNLYTENNEQDKSNK
jgi:hypothetical protein